MSMPIGLAEVDLDGRAPSSTSPFEEKQHWMSQTAMQQDTQNRSSQTSPKDTGGDRLSILWHHAN